MAGMDDFRVTEAKIAALVERILAAADPEEIIVFGSRARGDRRAGSDLDLAVIVELDSPELWEKIFKDQGRWREAEENARAAIAAADQDKSGFRYQQKLGLVTESEMPLLSRVQRILDKKCKSLVAAHQFSDGFST
jgi:hypothetical protein